MAIKPKCAQCGRALYKTVEKGKHAAKTAPFCFCRNPSCSIYGKDQTEGEIESTEDKPITEGEATEEVVDETVVEDQKEEVEKESVEAVETIKQTMKQSLLDCQNDNEFVED